MDERYHKAQISPEQLDDFEEIFTREMVKGGSLLLQRRGLHFRSSELDNPGFTFQSVVCRQHFLNWAEV